MQTLYRESFLLQSLCDQGQSLRVCCKFARDRTNVRNELATSCSHLRTRTSPLCKHNCLLQVCRRLTAGLLQTFQFRKGLYSSKSSNNLAAQNKNTREKNNKKVMYVAVALHCKTYLRLIKRMLQEANAVEV